MKHGSVANTVLCVNLAMIGKSRSNLSIKSFWSFDYFGRIFNFFSRSKVVYTHVFWIRMDGYAGFGEHQQLGAVAG